MHLIFNKSHFDLNTMNSILILVFLVLPQSIITSSYLLDSYFAQVVLPNILCRPTFCAIQQSWSSSHCLLKFYWVVMEFYYYIKCQTQFSILTTYLNSMSNKEFQKDNSFIACLSLGEISFYLYWSPQNQVGVFPPKHITT